MTRLWTTVVRRREQLTPKMIRVTVGGDELAEFVSNGTDQNVILYFYAADAVLPEPLTLASARAHFATDWPTMRTYTVRSVDVARQELAIDFVVHEGGHAAAWAAAAQPGDRLIFAGPSSAFAVDPAVDCFLLAADETALPAVGALLAELPATGRAQVFVEIPDDAERQPLPSPAAVELSWLPRGGASPGSRLVPAVRTADFPAGLVHAWVGAEAAAVRDLRRYLREERGLRRGQTSITVYWRR